MVNEVSAFTQAQMPVGGSGATQRPEARRAPEQKERVREAELPREVARTGQQGGEILPPGQQQEEEAAAVPNVESVVAQMKDYVQNVKRDLEFTIDEESGRTIITVKDSETDEVIRQIPPEELLHVVKALQENKASLFVETKA